MVLGIVYENSLTEFRFRVLLFVLRSAGYTFNTKKVPKYYYIYTTILNTLFFITYVGVTLDLIYGSDEFSHAMTTLRVWFTLSYITWIHINLSLRKDAVDRLLHLTELFTWDQLPKKEPITGYQTMAGWIPRIQPLIKWTIVSALIIHYIQCAFRYVRNQEMFYVVWYPFDTSSSPTFQIILLLQFFGTWLNLSAYFGFMGTYFIMVCIACSQLEKLKINLLNIQQKSTPQDKHLNIKVIENEEIKEYTEEFHHMQEELNSCIHHHNLILKFMKGLEDAFNFILCGLFLLLLMSICSVAFSAVTNWGNFVDLIQVVLMYVLTMATVCMICSFGNELTLQAREISQAAYGMEWPGTPNSFQRCVNFIIFTANKDFALTAGKFVPISNETLMNMLKQTLSFFMFLLEMRKRNMESEEIVEY